MEATTEDCLRLDVSSSEPDEESEKRGKTFSVINNHIHHYSYGLIPGGVRVMMGD